MTDDDDPIERCAELAHHTYTRIGVWADISDEFKDVWRRVAEAVLSEASIPPPAAPAPITADDVRAAEQRWLGRRLNPRASQDHFEFVADYLNRRSER